jgi:hypothetical protein
MDTPSSRNSQGQFAPGNRGGPGRPRGRANALRRAAEDAVSPEHIGAITRRAVRMALEGNLSAMKFVFDRTCGKPVEGPSEAVASEVMLPNLTTAASCAAALDRIAEGLCSGAVDRETARVMVDVVQARLRAIETSELEARLAELEAAAQSVELGGRRRGGRR